MDSETIAYITTAIIVLNHIAAFTGKPEVIAGIKLLSKIWDVFHGNYKSHENLK